MATNWELTEKIRRLEAEVARLRLTAEEREAIHWCIGDVADISGPVEDTLRGLLDRLSLPATSAGNV